MIEINVHRRGKLGRAWGNVQHLSGTDISRFARVLVQGKARASFEDDQFVATGSRRFQGERRASDADGHGIRRHVCAAGILWHAEKD